MKDRYIKSKEEKIIKVAGKKVVEVKNFITDKVTKVKKQRGRYTRPLRPSDLKKKEQPKKVKDLKVGESTDIKVSFDIEGNKIEE